jgi:hypothetical protein
MDKLSSDLIKKLLTYLGCKDGTIFAVTIKCKQLPKKYFLSDKELLEIYNMPSVRDYETKEEVVFIRHIKDKSQYQMGEFMDNFNICPLNKHNPILVYECCYCKRLVRVWTAFLMADDGTVWDSDIVYYDNGKKYYLCQCRIMDKNNMTRKVYLGRYLL